ALGHPLGAAGLRCLVTLTHVLEQRQLKKGIVCVCFGGGGAIALGLERGGFA
ncbi:MAG TPA: acetyl-CoA C-acetyltransferase, partial [Candidatus Omnitrophota bacterium]|nr:acetyl-CoA C-acetyltransferase [Candidatus Omnitrophota bacterium]